MIKPFIAEPLKWLLNISQAWHPETYLFDPKAENTNENSLIC